MSQITRSLSWINSDSFAAWSTRWLIRFVLVVLLGVVIDVFVPVPWWLSLLGISAVTMGVLFLKRSRMPPPDPVPELKSEAVNNHQSDTIVIEAAQDDDGIDQVHGVMTRHWKFFAKRVAGLVMGGIVFMSFGIAAALQNFFVIPVDAWLIYITLSTLLVPIMTYLVKREQFRWRHLVVEIRGDDVILIFPDSRLFFFTGGSLTVPILTINTIRDHDRTKMELFFFTRVRTVTIDSPSDKDAQFHAMPDILDALDKIELLKQRKHDLLRVSGNSAR